MQSFTSVVGPNGSGKSNVIDAMLFVFGKRAKQVSMYTCHTYPCIGIPSGSFNLCIHYNFALILQLRLNKVSELIHNSTNHKNLSLARVIVHFQGILDTVSSLTTLGADIAWWPVSFK